MPLALIVARSSYADKARRLVYDIIDCGHDSMTNEELALVKAALSSLEACAAYYERHGAHVWKH